jgi:hypothetical protein
VKPKEGDIFISNLDGETFVVEKIVDEMAVLRSKDGKREILTAIGSLRSLYQKKDRPEDTMQGEELEPMKTGSERRKNTRFLVGDNVIASLQNGSIKIGKVIDISVGGLSFEHVDSEEESNHESKKHILLSVNGFNLPKLSCRVVYDIPVRVAIEYQAFPIDFKTRRYGVQFEGLSEYQDRQLKFFLETYTKGTVP